MNLTKSCHHHEMVQDFKLRFWICLGVTCFILLLSPMIQGWIGLSFAQTFAYNNIILFFLSSFVFFYGGWPFLGGMVHEIKERLPGMMTLIALAIIISYVYSSAIVFGVKGKLFFWELATLIDIMLLGHWIEMRSVMSAGKALEKLAALMPRTAHKILQDGNIQDVSIDQINKGDHVLIKPGEKIPADGEIVEGESSINEAMLTGESKPVKKGVGAKVIGGAMNGNQSLKVHVEKTGKESYLSSVIDLVQEAQKSKSKTQDLANKAAFILTLIAIGSGIVTFGIWFFFTPESLSFAMERTVTVMVITCPHALGLAVPLVIAVSTSLAAKNGLLIRKKNAFEKAYQTTAVIFDKTGTITEGSFGITDIITYNKSEEQVRNLAAALESHSEHPLARGMVRNDVSLPPVEQFEALVGTGVKGVIHGEEVKIVGPHYLQEKNISWDQEKTELFQKQGKTVVFVLIQEKLVGIIALADILRPHSKEAIQKLKERGIYTLMITGDHENVAKWVANEVGIDETIAGVLPHEKKDCVIQLQKRGHFVAMAGDGINDAPALASADVSIAIQAGTDIAVDTADIILVKNNLMDLLTTFNLSKKTYHKTVQNLFWALGYNIVAIPIAAGILYKWDVIVSPAVGAIFMSLSTVICAINAKLLRLS